MQVSALRNKRLKSLSHSHEWWHPRSTSTSGSRVGGVTVFSHTFHILYLSNTFCIIDTLFLVLVYLSYTFFFHILYLFIYFLLVLCTFHILSYTVLCPFHILSYTMYYSYTVLFHIISYCTFKCILSLHSSAMLLISCPIFYTYNFLLGFMSAYTLEADTGNNCMYP